MSKKTKRARAQAQKARAALGSAFVKAAAKPVVPEIVPTPAPAPAPAPKPVTRTGGINPRRVTQSTTATIKYPSLFYTPEAVKAADNLKVFKDEYTRLRDIAQKRVARMAKDPYARGTEYYKSVAGGFPKLRDLTTPGQLGDALNRLRRFVESKTSSVSGIKEAGQNTLATLHSLGSGFDWVTMDNLAQFGKFMDVWRELGRNRMLGSSESVSAFYKSGAYENAKSESSIRAWFEDFLADPTQWEEEDGEDYSWEDLIR